MPEFLRAWPRNAWVVGLAILCGWPATLPAQGVPWVQTVLTDEPNPPSATISLRPHAPTSLHFKLKNPKATPLRDVTVKLFHVEGTKTRLIAQNAKTLEKLAKDDEVAVEWVKPAVAPEKTILSQPPFSLRMSIEGQRNKEAVVIHQNLLVVIKEPRDYMDVAGKYEKEKRMAVVTVNPKSDELLPGSNQIRVRLGVGPEFEPNKKGTHVQILTGPKQQAKLFCEDLAFIGTAAGVGKGHLFIDVDGFERAFIFHPVELAGTGELGRLNLGQTVRARIHVRRFDKANPKFPVRLEIDGPLDPSYSVEVALDRAGEKKEFLDVVRKTGLRDQKIELRIDDGGLVCAAQVKDWQFDFDTTGIDGNLYFRVAVFRKDEPQKLTVPTEVRGDIAPSNLDAGSQYAYARVNQDESKPENVEFVNVPKEWPIGKSMKAHVRVRKREESQAPVDQIVFFRGEPAADGKLNPESIIGKGVFDPAKSECFFELPPREKGEVLPLSVKVTTKSGAFAFAAATINFKADSEPGKVLAKLVGHVVRGDLGQPGLEVSLTDEKGNAKGKAKTGGQGKFVFEKVAPGVYFLSASRPSLGLTGRIRVEVPDGTALIDDLTLKLSVK